MISFSAYMKGMKELQESVSDIVFHRTQPVAALSILKDNAFKLTALVGSSTEPGSQQSDKIAYGDHWFYFSVARSPSSSYFKTGASTEIYFELDGRKLSQRYKAKAVDYFGHRDGRPDWMTGNDYFKDEKEDRIFSNSPTIPNAADYILAAHVLCENMLYREVEDQVRRGTPIGGAINACLRRDIPTFIYPTRESFIRRDKRKAINLDLSLIDDDKFPAVPRNEYDPLMIRDYVHWETLTHAKKYLELDKIAKDYVDFLLRYRPENPNPTLVDEIESNIANNRTSRYIGAYFELFKEVGARSATDFVRALTVKWTKLYNDYKGYKD